MADRDPILAIVPAPGAVPVRTPLAGFLSTIGSEPEADIRLTTVPPRWVIVQREPDDTLLIRVLASGASHRLASGAPLEVDGVVLALEHAAREAAHEGLPLSELAAALSGAEAPEEALSLLVRGLIRATGADGGAIILRRGDDYTVPVAETSAGGNLEGAEALLSDTLVRDVLQSGDRVGLRDAAASERYGQVPSVVSLRLRSVLCVPMSVGDGVLGAIFLGKQGLQSPFSSRHEADLSVIATMAVPVLVQLERAARASAGTPALDLIVGDSEPMAEVRRLVARVAPADLAVLVVGDTGTGKEVVARAIHASSPRASRPMVALNCAAVPEGLLAAELFGALKGAFTGAVTDRKGRFEQADGSTLFLDEVGDMPLPMQAALLRVLEERVVTRLGDSEPRPVDYRLVAATHRDLDAEVSAGRFRQDLLYRLREMVIPLPPLTSRDDDVLLLAQLFLRQAEEQLGLSPHHLGPRADVALRRHRWPGNVRELRAAVRRAAILADGATIEPDHLQLGGAPPRGPASAEEILDLDQTLAAAREGFVTRYVSAVLDRHEGNREAAAAALEISVRSLYRYLSAGAK